MYYSAGTLIGLGRVEGPRGFLPALPGALRIGARREPSLPPGGRTRQEGPLLMPAYPTAPIPVIQVEREARALLGELAAMGEPLPAVPTVYGRPVLHAVVPLEDPESDR